MNEAPADRQAVALRRTAPLTADAFHARSIDLYMTSVCTRRCTFCFLSDEFLNSRSLMPYPMMEAILDWAAVDGPIREITLLGGEPATHPNFVKIVHAAKDRKLAVRTVTNGSKAFRTALRDPSVAHALNRVAVSVDAPNSTVMDRLRGRGAFTDAQSTIDDLRSAKIPFDINCTVVKSCVDYLPEMLHYAQAQGANRLNVHWFSAVGRAKDHAPGETVDPQTWRDGVLEKVKAYRSPRPDYVVDCELAYAFGNLGDDLNACAVRKRENLQFFPSGAVFSCGLLVEDESLSGYVWDGGNLYERVGKTEVAQANACNTCAFRTSADGYKAQCIYNRLDF